MKLINCIALLVLYCTFVQVSCSDSKKAYFPQASNPSAPECQSMQSPASQAINSMAAIRLSTQSSDINSRRLHFLATARTDRLKTLLDCAQELKKSRVDRGSLKKVCTKLSPHLYDSEIDNKVSDKIEAIRDRFYGSTGSSMYNINPVWWFYSDRAIRKEASELTKLLFTTLAAEPSTDSVEAQLVELPSSYENYDHE